MAARGLKNTVLNCADDTALDWYTVSREVNNVRNECPNLIHSMPVEREFSWQE
jgi:putative SOS response-associated peptidase YedK